MRRHSRYSSAASGAGLGLVAIIITILVMVSIVNESAWETDVELCRGEAACMRSRGWHGNGPAWDALTNLEGKVK